MARGWESKSVEAQMEAAAAAPAKALGVRPTAVQLARQRERQSLELARTKVLRDLAAATHARHREMLEAALKHLDDRLAETRLKN
jgi:hypothetical protein